MRLGVGVLMAVAGFGQPLENWRGAEGESRVAPKMACAELRGQTGYEFSVITAVMVDDYCRVMGQILPEVRFEVNLPGSWNRRLYMFGNGGFAGENLDAANRAGQRTRALKHGFAVTSTNTGHDAATEPLATFAVNRQKLIDYSFRSLHVTAVTAKKLAEVYYGSRPARSYFNGCSTGGRQALILAQRFPEDFDGILVGAPVLDFTGTMLSYASTAKALAAAPLTEAKVKLLAGRVYEACDAKDGLKDGLIDDPRLCAYSPAKDLPRCAGADGPDCFTDAQSKALETLYGDVHGPNGRLFPGWPLGVEPAWAPWIVRDGQPTISVTFAQSFFKYMAFPDVNANFELKDLSLEKDLPRMAGIRQMLDAVDPDLSAFRARGRKMIMYYGWADSALNPLMGVEYYEGVLKKMGAGTRDFFRLFMVPGMFHCAGGVGTDRFDAFTPLAEWTEGKQAPALIVASQAKPARTRPLCVYPEVAKYKGSGSVDEAGSFVCAQR
ncbi:MAG: tannase/feruloyl esterase family alpha/beta hydrolase [Acidimicrobiia bacterium]|nr:tannase/feruloyl esterase family alpha/beta hydrolase [Acidimicrobiia bacterium]